LAPITQLEKELVRLQVVTSDQWQKARTLATDPRKIKAVVEELSAQRAWWCSATAPDRTPALTAYQREQIARWLDKKDTAALAAGLRLNSYLLLDKLGKGGMGVVFRAWDLRKGRIVAVKTITNPSPELQKRFQREAKLLKRLTHHCIASFLDFEQCGETRLLVIEYVPGVNLEHKVKSEGPLPWRQAVRWTLDILGALDHAHARGVIHRDVKPANLIVHDGLGGSVIKLIDLGLGKRSERALDPNESLGGDVTEIGQVVGTPAYMSPEHCKGPNDIVAASDIYSLGCTFFYLLTGKKPFEMPHLASYVLAHTTAPRPSLLTFCNEVPTELDQIVRQMMDFVPSRRGSPTELKASLRSLMTGIRQPVAQGPRLPPATSRADTPDAGEASNPTPQSQITQERLTPATRPGARPQASPVETPEERRRKRERAQQKGSMVPAPVRALLGVSSRPGTDAVQPTGPLFDRRASSDLTQWVRALVGFAVARPLLVVFLLVVLTVILLKIFGYL